MTRGVTLLSIGSEGYLWWAVNMAASIKFYAPDLPIQLVGSADIIKRIKDYRVEKAFDHLTEMSTPDYMDVVVKPGRATGTVIAPGRAKLKLPDYFIFDRTVYLDVDGCAVKDITPLFDTPADFATHVHCTYPLGSIEAHPDMYWCNSSAIMQHYGLSAEAEVPATQSSFILYTKTPANQQLFKQAWHNIAQNPIPVANRNKTWGRGHGMQPDELYLNIACAQTNTYPLNVQPIYFRMVLHTGKYKEVGEIRNSHYLIGLYGSADFTHHSLKSVYNRHMRSIWQTVFPQIPFRKCEDPLNYKVAGQKFL